MASKQPKSKSSKGKEKVKEIVVLPSVLPPVSRMAPPPPKRHQMGIHEKAESAKNKAKQRIRLNQYLDSLLNPIDNPAKIPDLVPYDSSVFSLKQIVNIPSSVNGDFFMVIAPWFNNMYLINTTGFAFTPSYGTLVSSSNVATVLSTYAAARPVSGSVTCKFTGSINTTQGTITCAVLNPFDVLPNSYLALSTMRDSFQGPCTDGLACLYTPVDSLSDTYVDTTWNFGMTGVVANSSAGQSSVLGVVGSTASTFVNWNSWYIYTGPNPAIVSHENHLPVICLGGSGLVASTPGLFQIEINLNFEGLIQNNAFMPGIQVSSPAVIDPNQYQVARSIVAQTPHIAPVAQVEKRGFWDKALPIIEKVANGISKAIPIIGAFL